MMLAVELRREDHEALVQLARARNQSVEEVLHEAIKRLREERELDERIRELTPTHEEFLRFAQKHQPPQSWFDDDTNPFEPET